MKLKSTILALYVMSIGFGCLLSLTLLPIPLYDDDGSYYKHTSVSAIIACVSSSIIPTSGTIVVNKIGQTYEFENNSQNILDTEADLSYNTIGAEIGSGVGTAISIVWLAMILGQFTKILCFSHFKHK